MTQYLEIFERQFADAAYYDRSVRPLLELVLASPAPLPLAFAREMLEWKGDAETAVIQKLDGLFTIREGAVAPVDESIRAWPEDRAQSGQYFIAASDARERLGRCLWLEYRRDGGSYHNYAKAALPALIAQADCARTLSWLDAPSIETVRALISLSRNVHAPLEFRGIELNPHWCGIQRVAALVAQKLDDVGDKHALEARWICAWENGRALAVAGREAEALARFDEALVLGQNCLAAARASNYAHPLGGHGGAYHFFLGLLWQTAAEALPTLAQLRQFEDVRRRYGECRGHLATFARQQGFPNTVLAAKFHNLLDSTFPLMSREGWHADAIACLREDFASWRELLAAAGASNPAFLKLIEQVHGFCASAGAELGREGFKAEANDCVLLHTEIAHAYPDRFAVQVPD